MTTAVVAIVFLGLMLLGVLFSAWLLQVGARWAKTPPVSFRRALGTIVLSNLVPFVVTFPFELALSRGKVHPIFWLIVLLPLQIGITWAVVKWMLRTSYPRAILAWLPTLLSVATSLAMAIGLVRPFLFEAFKIPTNSMAPTILGEHRRHECPKCGGVLITTGIDYRGFAPPEAIGICTDCQQTSVIAIAADSGSGGLQAGRTGSSLGTTFGGDRILVTKFLRPRRWDLVVFRSPEDPTIPFVKRLVGLPGEEITLHDDAIWIDGVRAEQPADIAWIVYSAGGWRMERDEWGPVLLGEGEYLVLGDFSLSAKDSRFWERGAPGHPKYAVPESYLIGVVTHTYWPPERWRVFR